MWDESDEKLSICCNDVMSAPVESSVVHMTEEDKLEADEENELAFGMPYHNASLGGGAEEAEVSPKSMLLQERREYN